LKSAFTIRRRVCTLHLLPYRLAFCCVHLLFGVDIFTSAIPLHGRVIPSYVVRPSVCPSFRLVWRWCQLII